MSALPGAIRAKAEMSPVEDLLLALLREALPGIRVQSYIEHNQTEPAVVVRRIDDVGEWRGDPRFLDSAYIGVQAFVAGKDADEDAAILSEVVRVTIRDSVNKVVPGRGHITKQEMTSAPRNATDWATATGPVQYADLPTGLVRYETQFAVEIRKPRTRPYPL